MASTNLSRKWSGDRREIKQTLMRSRMSERRHLAVVAPATVYKIIQEAEIDHGIEDYGVLSTRKFRPLANARCQAAQEMHYRLGLSLTDIARYLGGMNHTSVWAMLQKPRWKPPMPPAATIATETIGVCDEWV